MNSKTHYIISLIKSSIRIATAILALGTNNVTIMIIGWLIAEFGGVFAKAFDDR